MFATNGESPRGLTFPKTLTDLQYERINLEVIRS